VGCKIMDSGDAGCGIRKDGNTDDADNADDTNIGYWILDIEDSNNS